jgi:hypothetical protein
MASSVGREILEGMSDSRSFRARFLEFLLCAVKRSDLFEDGRTRPRLVLLLGSDDEDEERRDESCEANARVVEEEISFFLFFGLRTPP